MPANAQSGCVNLLFWKFVAENNGDIRKYESQGEFMLNDGPHYHHNNILNFDSENHDTHKKCSTGFWTIKIYSTATFE